MDKRAAELDERRKANGDSGHLPARAGDVPSPNTNSKFYTPADALTPKDAEIMTILNIRKYLEQKHFHDA